MMDAIYAWAAVSRSVVWYVAVIGCLLWLFQGGKALATGDRSRKVLLEILLSGAFFFGMGILTHKMTDLTEDARSQLGAVLASPVQVEQRWGEQFSPIEREQYSRMLASAAFIYHGKILKYFDHEAGWKEYSPTAADRSQIQERAQLDGRLQESVENGRQQAAEFWIFGLVAFCLGLVHHRMQAAFKKR